MLQCIYVYLNDVHRWLNGHAGVHERVFFYLHKFRMIDATCTKLNGEQLVTAFILWLSSNAWLYQQSSELGILNDRKSDQNDNVLLIKQAILNSILYFSDVP